MTASAIDCCPAETISILSVTGRDARQFLHAQLTQDLSIVEPGRAAPAAWLDAKGRVRACLDVVPVADGFCLLAPASLADALVAQLGMFVLRADVSIEKPEDHVCFSIVGATKAWLADAGIDLDVSPYAHAAIAGTDWIRIGADLIRVCGSQADISAALGSMSLADSSAAELAEINLGRPQVDSATERRFTAQMLNLDLLGAISFDKGCYPGQEIVARAHNLGTIKRRMFRFLAPDTDPPRSGTPVNDTTGEEVGTVIRSAQSDSGAELLAVTRIELADSQLLLPNTTAPLQRLRLPTDVAA